MCYNHKESINSFTFDSWVILEQIKDKLENNCVHLANEALVFGLSKIYSKDIAPRIILAIPICCHNNLNLIKQIVQCILYTFQKSMSKAKIINIATDGDLNCQKALNELREVSYSFN